MKISKKLTDAINKQINAEMYSSYLYLSMATYLDDENFPGMTSWMKKQAKEENDHAMKFAEHLSDRGAKVNLMKVDGPKTTWRSPLVLFEEAYKHELKVTKMIEDLMDLARKEKDKAAEMMLAWFITEQIEEEAIADAIVQKLKKVANSNQGLIMLDNELARRE